MGEFQGEIRIHCINKSSEDQTHIEIKANFIVAMIEDSDFLWLDRV